ncbi:MAG: rod shape-determining protein MreD [Oscillospiraceae bacterium]|nr:rod shape-determining protein MreD [Oscillospiraceae bacterium]
MDSSKRAFYKWVSYGILISAIMIVESTLLCKISLFHATPSLVPYLVAAIAMREGISGAAGIGLLAGVITDAMIPSVTGFYTIAFVVCGIVVGLLCRVLFQKHYPASLLYWLICVVIKNAAYYVVVFVLWGRPVGAELFLRWAGEVLTTVLFTPILYWAVWNINRRYLSEEESGV